jgi:hypothetical protein
MQQFNISEQIVYFPELGNHTDNYNYVGTKVPFSDYISLWDTPNEIDQKLQYYNQYLRKIGIFKKL